MRLVSCYDRPGDTPYGSIEYTELMGIYGQTYTNFAMGIIYRIFPDECSPPWSNIRRRRRPLAAALLDPDPKPSLRNIEERIHRN